MTFGPKAISVTNTEQHTVVTMFTYQPHYTDSCFAMTQLAFQCSADRLCIRSAVTERCTFS
jgi:hypothetical protein